jgi:hypothetical protein
LSFILAITVCIKKQQNPVSDAPDAGISSQTDTTEQDDLDDIVVEYCETGNCPCGNGFCSKGSYCIKDMCFCGAYPDEGYFENTIASNDYGEFECMKEEYHEGGGCGGEEHFFHYFICSRDNGCETADGRKYSKTKDFDDDPRMNDEVNEITRSGDYATKDEYEEIIRERFLTKTCGPKLPEDLKYMKREGSGSYHPCWSSPSHNDQECDLRQKCNDIGVTADNISEYICDIGRYPYIPCENDRLVFTNAYRDDPIGLRCNRPEGCTCGTTHCPNLALCIDGQCKYDLYYEHHTCPGDNWDPNKFDAVNYALQNHKCTPEDLIQKCTDYGYDEYGVDDCADEFDELCAEDYYWKQYRSKISLKDPCSSQTGQ